MPWATSTSFGIAGPDPHMGVVSDAFDLAYTRLGTEVEPPVGEAEEDRRWDRLARALEADE